MKEMATFHHELLSEDYFFKSFKDYDQKTFRKKWKSNSISLVNEFFSELNSIESFNTDTI